MPASVLTEVDLGRCHRWLLRIAGADAGLAACGADGQRVWTSPGDAGDALGRRLQTAGGAAAFAAADAEVDATATAAAAGGRQLGDGSTLLWRRLEGYSGSLIGWLATCTGPNPDANADVRAAATVDALADALDDLADAVAEDCRQRLELLGMTEELSERYEELHLVYGADRHVRENTNELDVFRALLGNCAEQMDVDVVAFLRPGENLCLSATELSRPIHNLDLVLVEMRGDLYRFVQSTRDTVVLNEPDDPRRAYIFTDMPYRVMACPVRRNNHIDSQLVLLNHAHKPQFSNSDRRLAEVLANQLSSLGQTYALLKRLGRFNEQLAAAMIEAIEAKDPYTRGHSERVNHISMEIGRALGLPADDLANLHWGSLLHDVGKIGIPDAVLCKPDRLTPDEFAFITMHSERSCEILRHVDDLQGALPGARHHHEKWDGNGYPLGLKGERIPLPARIIAVADTYDSITSSRAYRAGRSHEAALCEIQRVCGTQLDPSIVAVFVELCAGEPEWIRRFSIGRDAVAAPAPAANTATATLPCPAIHG